MLVSALPFFLILPMTSLISCFDVGCDAQQLEGLLIALGLQLEAVGTGDGAAFQAVGVMEGVVESDADGCAGGSDADDDPVSIGLQAVGVGRLGRQRKYCAGAQDAGNESALRSQLGPPLGIGNFQPLLLRAGWLARIKVELGASLRPGSAGRADGG